MKNNLSYNLTSEVLKAFETATEISYNFGDNKVRSGYLLLGLINLGTTAINRLLAEQGLMLLIPISVEALLGNHPMFEKIFGEEALNNLLGEEAENPEDEEIYIESTEEVNNKNNTEYEVRELVLQCLEEIVTENVFCEEDFPEIRVSYSENLESAITDAAARCQKAPGMVIDADNLLYSLILNEDSSAYRLLSQFCVSLNEVDMTEDDVIEYIELNSNIYSENSVNKVVVPKALESCCEVYNNKFVKGEKSEIVGRDKQKAALWNTFSKKEKKNAILIGPAGAGKTAIIEAITQDIVNKTCPRRFVNYTVIEFSTAGAIAGTKYRGEFETKVMLLKKFIEQTPNVILFIDEIHSIVGAGAGTEDKNDLSGALKSTLSRGDAIVVGTTTYNEYKKSIATDVALQRRFNVIEVKEPKYDEVKDMIKLKIRGLEKFHNVKVSDKVLNYIITVAFCFNSELCNPDKTISLCDSAMAIAENKGTTSLTREHVDEVYSDNFEKFEKMSEETRKYVARHESAHYVVGKILRANLSSEVVAISIVPGFDFCGANILEITDDYNINDGKEYYISEICSLLAGRAASDEYRSGDNSDLEKATNIANMIVTKFGMDSVYENLAFSSLFESEQVSNNINQAIAKIISDAYKKTVEILKIHEVLLKNVANALLKKHILSKSELDKIYEDYIKNYSV